MKGRAAATTLALAAAALVAGCGGVTPAGRGPAPQAPPGGTPFLATSLVTAAGAWAITVMGGSVASHNNFWQLFVRPAASSRWRLVTPPGVADNGGLVAADAGGPSLITAVRPSQYLTYTPLTETRDGGLAWSPTGPLEAALANSPGALAESPATGHLLALLASGAASLAGPGYTRWTTIASQHALAATPAGRRCGLGKLAAVAFTSSGTPLLAGACSRPGTAGIFAAQHGTWQPAGPAVPASLAGQDITVLRLATTGTQTAALLQTGSGHFAGLLAAWSSTGTARWTISPVLPLGGAAVASASFGPTGTAAVTTTDGAGAVITSAGGPWHQLPSLPPGTATLVPSPGGEADALAVHAATLTVWRIPASGTAWTRAQVIKVPIQYGSSG
jgi:hypothetical protein